MKRGPLRARCRRSWAGSNNRTMARSFWTRLAVSTWQSSPSCLQVLQDGTFVRVGGHEPRSIATRLVSASNSDLRNQVEDGTFRLDFLFRINAVTINLPPLRQRIADLPILIDYFIDHYARDFPSIRRNCSPRAPYA